MEYWELQWRLALAIWPYQNGYNTKDATSNGGVFQLSVRLGRYTQNQTYSHGAYISGAAYMYSVTNGESPNGNQVIQVSTVFSIHASIISSRRGTVARSW